MFKRLLSLKNIELVNLGIIPTRTGMSYGYNEAKGEDVVKFREKPAMELAEKFLKNFNFI